MNRIARLIFPVVAALALTDMAPISAPTTSAPIHTQIAKLPLRFEANAGQWDERVGFVARSGGVTLFLTDAGATIKLRDVEQTATITMKLVGATPRAPRGEQELGTKSNFFLGNDHTKWRTNVPNFAQVRTKNSLSGVDIVWHGGEGGLEYDLAVAAGTDASTIALDIEGAESLHVRETASRPTATATHT